MNIDEQRMAALRKGNLLRMRRAAWKRDLRELDILTGWREVADTITRYEWDNELAWLGGMRVEQMLSAAPGLGSVKVGRLMRRGGVANRLSTLDGIGRGRREKLAAALTREADRYAAQNGARRRWSGVTGTV